MWRCLSPPVALGLMLALGLAPAALARAAGTTADLEGLLQLGLEELLDINVTTASKFAQKTADAPSTITVVPREQIERYGWRSIQDVLYRQPGFAPGQDYERSTVPTRGVFESWNGNHLLHLVDGIPMNSNLYGAAFTWDITPLHFAKSLEVMRGPGSALYGSNATNGVVQVNTLDADDLRGRSQARIEGGGPDSRRYELAVADAGERVSAVAAFAGFSSDGNEYLSYDGSGRTDAAGQLQRFRTHDAHSSSYVFGKLNFHQALDGLMLQYHHQDWDFETGHGWLWWIPDFAESMSEYRDIVALRFQPPTDSRLDQDYVLRYQRHGLDWTMRYYPNGAFADYYPAGMWEHLDTHVDDVFAQAQFRYTFANSVQALLGLEGDYFRYPGDDEHFATVNVDSPGFEPFPNNQPQPLGPYLDFILDQPIWNQAVFGQLSSGQRLGERWQLTAGARYDRLEVDYQHIDQPGRPPGQRTFAQLSPRLAAVFRPRPELALKLLWGRAFRVPSLSELAGAHTFAVASNIDALQPEEVSTTELAADWRLNANLNLRTNVFATTVDNLIAYSTQNNNLSTNVFSQETRGLELELLAHYPTGRGTVSGFANASYTARGNETVLDNTIAEHDHRQTWTPARLANVGLNWDTRRWQWSVSSHYQGAVLRRDSEVGVQTLPLGVGVTLDLDQYRPRKVPSWRTVDTQLSTRFGQDLRLGLRITNLFDKDDAFLLKTGPFPFDYRQPGRASYVFLQVNL